MLLKIRFLAGCFACIHVPYACCRLEQNMPKVTRLSKTPCRTPWSGFGSGLGGKRDTDGPDRYTCCRKARDAYVSNGGGVRDSQAWRHGSTSEYMQRPDQSVKG